MKNISIIITAIFIFAVFFDSCKKATYLTANVENITFPKEGGNDSIILKSDVGSYKIFSQPEWVEVSIEKDSILVLRTKSNDENKIKSGNIIVGNGDLKLSIPVRQMKIATYLTFNEKSVSIPQTGGRIELEIETDGGNVKLEGIENINSFYKNGRLTLSSNGNEGPTRKTNAFIVSDSIKRPILVIESGTICTKCKGSGKITCYICRGTGVDYCPYRTCDLCHGRLKVTCTECKGKGK